MRKTFFSAVALVALAGQAIAADLPSRKDAPTLIAPTPVYDWSGFYIGAQVGGEFGNGSNYVPSTNVGKSWANNGVFGGGHLGYNYQINSFVLGLQGEFNGSGASGTWNDPSGWIHKNSQSWLGSLDGRLGFAVNRALFYAVGGVAFSDSKQNPSFGGVGYQFATDRTGYDVGAGVEYAFTNNWITGVEYRYYDFGNSNWAALGRVPAHTFRQTDNTVRLSVSYKFGGAEASVVAKY